MPCFSANQKEIRFNAQIFVWTSVFFAAWFTLSQPSTPVRNATNLWTFCLESIFYAFWMTLLLWHPLIRSLYFIQIYCTSHKYCAPFLRFSHILLYTNFFHTFNSTPNLLTPCLLGICNHQEDTFCLTKKSCAFHAWCKFWQNYKLTSPDPKC